MRLLTAILLPLLLLPLAAPSAAATVRDCNPSDLPVWVDAGCYSWWAEGNCLTYWQLDWCAECRGSLNGLDRTVQYLLICLPILDQAHPQG